MTRIKDSMLLGITKSSKTNVPTPTLKTQSPSQADLTLQTSDLPHNPIDIRPSQIKPTFTSCASQTGTERSRLMPLSPDTAIQTLGAMSTLPPLGDPGPYTNKVATISLDPSWKVTQKIYTKDALRLVEKVHHALGGKVQTLLSDRARQQAIIDAEGQLNETVLTTLKTSSIESLKKQDGSETVTEFKDAKCVLAGTAASPKQVSKRQATKDPINTLEDNEDSNIPSPEKMAEGIYNLTTYRKEKGFPKNPQKFRPPGLHLPGTGLYFQNIQTGEQEASSELITDITLYLFHNLNAYIKAGKTLEFYIPKLKNEREAALIEETISFIFKEMGLDSSFKKHVKLTLMVETFEACVKVEKMIKALQPYISAVNFGRWDMLFDLIKTLSKCTRFPDRNFMGMNTPSIIAAQKRIIAAAQKYDIRAEGGMSGVVLEKNESLRKKQLAKVIDDKLSELLLGFKAAWVAQPDPNLVSAIETVFSENDQRLLALLKEYEALLNPQLVADVRNFIAKGRPEPNISDKEIDLDALLHPFEVAPTHFTEAEFDNLIRISLQYRAGVYLGIGAVNVDGNMIDEAVEEILMQLAHHWIHNNQALTPSATPPKLGKAMQEAEADLKRKFTSGQIRGFENYAKETSVLKTVNQAIENARKALYTALSEPNLAFTSEHGVPILCNHYQRSILTQSAVFPRIAEITKQASALRASL
ncbi:hypothetical protein DID77_00540 [Candidatus Marinamargulisbacteria bacterium SCGC AG-439-L15]|nr:hypothetical protein DID77_00540 [Candidatus Marinamargulisbacteria bacterium SCGC AG-439-L15]